MKQKQPIISLLLAVLCSLTFSHVFAQTADTIYHNGSILHHGGRESRPTSRRSPSRTARSCLPGARTRP